MLFVKKALGKIEMKKNEQDSIFACSWRNLNEDVVKNNNINKNITKNNLAANLLAAFLIVIISGYSLGLVRKTVVNPHIFDKFQNSRVIVYSNIA